MFLVYFNINTTYAHTFMCIHIQSVCMKTDKGSKDINIPLALSELKKSGQG